MTLETIKEEMRDNLPRVIQKRGYREREWKWKKYKEVQNKENKRGD